MIVFGWNWLFFWPHQKKTIPWGDCFWRGVPRNNPPRGLFCPAPRGKQSLGGLVLAHPTWETISGEDWLGAPPAGNWSRMSNLWEGAKVCINKRTKLIDWFLAAPKFGIDETNLSFAKAVCVSLPLIAFWTSQRLNLPTRLVLECYTRERNDEKLLFSAPSKKTTTDNRVSHFFVTNKTLHQSTFKTKA